MVFEKIRAKFWKIPKRFFLCEEFLSDFYQNCFSTSFPCDYKDKRFEIGCDTERKIALWQFITHCAQIEVSLRNHLLYAAHTHIPHTFLSWQSSEHLFWPFDIQSKNFCGLSDKMEWDFPIQQLAKTFFWKKVLRAKTKDEERRTEGRGEDAEMRKLRSGVPELLLDCRVRRITDSPIWRKFRGCWWTLNVSRKERWGQND